MPKPSECKASGQQGVRDSGTSSSKVTGVYAPYSPLLRQTEYSLVLAHQAAANTNIFWIIRVPLLLSVATVKAQKFQNATNETLIFSKDAKGMEKQECCQEKNVGNVSYTLLADQYIGKLPDHCLNDCVYTIINSSSPKFCFARGFVS